MLDFLHFGGLDKPNGGWHSLIGIITAIIGNILISFALNTQRYAHIRLNRQYQQDEEERKRGKRSANRDSQQERIAEEREQQNLNGNGSHAEASESDPLLPSSASTSSESTIRPNKNSTATGPKSYLKSPIWWLGIALMTVGEAGNFLAYGFAPASVVSPLGVVALVSNCLIAPLLLHEQFRIRDGLGVIVAVGGCVTVVLSASDNNPKLGPDKIWELISTWEFKTYFGITVFLMLVLMSVSSRYGHKSVMIDLGLVGLFGGYTALSTKGVASLLSNTIWHVVTFPITYLLVAVLVTTAVLQIKYLNRALQHFDSTQVIPVQFVLFTLSVIIGSAILYRDFERTTTDDAIKFFAGCALTFSGVWLITSGRGKSRQHDEEEGSEDGEAIDLLDEEHNQPEIRERHDSNTRRASLQPPSDRRLKSSHSDAPSFVITSDDTPSQPFTFEASSPLNENPWALPAPANISSIHPRSPASVAAEQNSKNPPPMHATTSAPVLPTIASQKLSPRRPTTPNRGISSPSMEHSPNALSPSHQRYRNIDVSEATPGRLNTLTQILPGPLTNTLSSSLSAIVADSLRKGIVESSPSNRRRVSGRSSRAESALRSIQSAKINDSIGLVMKIREKIAKATFSLHWVPGHEGIRGNERANELAQKATEVTSSMPNPTDKVPISAIYARAKAMEFKPENQEFYGATTGKHLQKIDKALPGKHTIKLYNALNRTAAAILVQLRTNISRLNTYLSKINAADTDKCECGMTETVSHFIFLCPRWRNERQEMKSAHGSRYCDLSYALGGYSIHEENGKKVDGEKDKWQPNVNAVKATIEFAKATGRLQRQT
ncbi:DUF803-domain-containing protein [Aureobasidium pullulans]|nr:DUF803-domain-containing protein [Aureobasidium pullulans]